MTSSSKKVVVYTALFGNYDILEDPKEYNISKFDFFCFTDNKKLSLKIWKTIVIDKLSYSPRIMNRMYKMLPHLFLNKYEESIYIDANIIIRKDLTELLENYFRNYDIVLPQHFRRNCLYDEAIEIITFNIESKEKVLEQISTYKKAGFPINFGLSENNIIYRKHLKKNVVKLMEDWWEEYLKYPTRDQLSLMYVIWKNFLEGNKPKILLINNFRGTKYFYFSLHKNYKRKGFFGKLINKFNEYRINSPKSKISLAIYLTKKLVYDMKKLKNHKEVVRNLNIN